MFNLGIFTTLVYLSPNILRAQGKLRNVSNMYDMLFSTEPCVTLVYSEPKSCSEPSQTSMVENFIQSYSESKACSGYCQTSITKYIIQNLVWIFRMLVYSEIWYIMKSKHIQNPAVYLRLDILLRTLFDYSRFRGTMYSKLSKIQNRCVSATP